MQNRNRHDPESRLQPDFIALRSDQSSPGGEVIDLAHLLDQSSPGGEKAEGPDSPIVALVVKEAQYRHPEQRKGFSSNQY